MENFDVSVQRFDEFAEEYASRFENVNSYLNQLFWFVNQVKTANPAILELACGPGNVTKFLKNHFPESRILAVDLAPKMIEIARKALPDVEFRVMDVRDISVIAEKFDAVMCSFCLPFLSKEDAAKLIADSSALLNPGGVIYLSTMEGDESRAGYEKTSFSGDSEVYFNYHRQTDLQEAFEKSGFKILKLDRQDYLEPDGSLTVDLIFVAEKIWR
ncbi:MAG TPA: class I SAM-dependent methyltransferase [Prolixibacteraceae bacterium]|nr:class I SAM-dependent methyltransferase [Prolixibacteraceae bacterium]